MNKYAYNFAEKKKSKILQGGVLDFDKLVTYLIISQYILIKLKGYYDDIENIDNEIKNSKKKLDVTKDWTIKSCAYSNLDVPSTWKNKLEYPNRLMKLINKDNSFFSYITKYGKTQDNNQKIQIETNEKYSSQMKEETKNFTTENALSRGRSIKKESQNLKNDFFDFQPSPPKSEDVSKSPSPSKYLPPSPSHPFGRKNTLSVTKNSKAYTSKEIREILDNYNEQYKVKKVPKENIENLTLANKEKHVILPNLIKHSDTTRGYSMIDNLNSTQKSQLFKSTIYNSMVPVKLNKISNEINISSSDKTSKKNTKSKTEYGPFLNFNYEEFNKKIEITNPEVKKLLEDLNYFGPHFSHCPSCRNKNLEFYETLEPSQCINILQFIKKSKKKNKK